MQSFRATLTDDAGQSITDVEGSIRPPGEAQGPHQGEFDLQESESFMQGVVSHEVSARIEYGLQDVASAAADTIAAEISGRGTTGALIAVTPAKRCVLAWDSPTLLAAWRDGDQLMTHI